MTLKISLVDNNYIVRAKTDLQTSGEYDRFGKFLKEIDDKLINGETAYLEIEGYERGNITFEISKFEW